MKGEGKEKAEFLWEKALDGALSEEAERHVAEQRAAAEKDPLNPQPYLNLGMLFQMQRRTEEAIAMYERAMAVDPKLAAPHRQLGQIYAVLGNMARARAHAQEAAALGDTTLLTMLKRYPRVT